MTLLPFPNKIAALFALGCLVSACAEEHPATPTAQFGWRSAGLVFLDADNTGGLRRLVNLGNTLFAMDSYESGKGPVSRPRQWRIWKGSVGSDRWEILPMPNGEIPSEFVVAGQNLVVGTQYTGKVYKYELGTGKWSEYRKAPLPGGVDTLPSTWGVGEFQSKVIVAITMNKTANHQCLIQEGMQDSLSRFPCMGPNKNANFYGTGSSGDLLYGYQSEWGVARYRLGDSLWETLPSPRGKTDITEFEFMSALTSVDGKVYVGYRQWGDGVFRWDDGVWTSMTPMDAQKRRETSRTVHVIAGYRGRLFQGGQDGSGIGMLIPRDSGKVVWGDWKLVDQGWCEIEGVGGCPWQTRAIVGIGDTLYAATWNAIVKVPFSELDQMARPMYSK